MQAAVDASALMMAKDAQAADATQLTANASNYFNATTPSGNLQRQFFLRIKRLFRELPRHRA